MAGRRVVMPGPGKTGWCVLDDMSEVPVHTAQTKGLAVERARADLRGLVGGGQLRVHLLNGAVEYERSVRGLELAPLTPAVPADPGTPLREVREVHDRIKKDGKQLDRGLDGLDMLLGFLGVVGVPVTSATISTEVQDALGDGWIAVFLATLTWTLGCAGAMVVGQRSGLVSYPLWGAVSACFFVALLIAGALGQGVLEVDTSVVTGLGPFNWLGSVVAAALATYGWLGTLVGAGIGAVLGNRLSRLVPDRFAV